jgi:phage-related protein (TIGR01555 family)
LKKPAQEKKNTASTNVLANSLTNLITDLGYTREFGEQLSQVATIIKNNRYYLVSNDRNLLTYMYSTHGVVQTIVDQPVEDAFKNGIIIDSQELHPDDIQEIQNYLKENKIIAIVKEAARWARLYGGAGIIINVTGNSQEPLDLEQINEDSFLEFYAADLWELQIQNYKPYGEEKPYVVESQVDTQYNFYGHILHNSRVMLVKGKEAPSLLRSQLRGWAMSEVERLVRSISQYFKNQDVIFELMDEAKVGVWKMTGFNQKLGSPGGTNKIMQSIAAVSKVKSFQNDMVMDKEDEFENKQMSFGGLPEMRAENRKDIACDTKTPISKLFGQSITGMNGGEDDIENYNSMIESEIRGKYDDVLVKIIQVICKKLFGITPKDLQVRYHPLRVLSAEQQENIKDKQFARLNALHDKGLLTDEEFIQQVNLASLCPTEIKEREGVQMANMETRIRERVRK